MDPDIGLGSDEDRTVLTVTEVNRRVKKLLEETPGLQDVWLRGELSNHTGPHEASGHMYFCMKDDDAQIDCVMWRRNARRVTAELQDGLEVLAHGSIGLYEQRGSYQFYVDRILEAGKGELFLEFQELKERLGEEGLFDPDRKRELPPFPLTIGVVTSKSGAAFQDVLNVLRRRSPHLRVILADARVQGDDASGTIVDAIERMNEHARHDEVDVILVTRGGGSLEDLWAFNEEPTVRAIAESRVPVISAVGHETDTTLSDLAADARAPTPSAGAELAAPSRDGSLERVDKAKRSLARRLKGLLRFKVRRLDGMASRPVLSRRGALLSGPWQRFDDLAARLPRAMGQRLQTERARVDGLAQRSVFRGVDALMGSSKQRLERLGDRLPRAARRNVEGAENRLEALGGRLEALSPLRVLERGYAVVTREGETVRSVRDVDKGQGLNVRVTDGRVRARVEDTQEDES